MEIPVQTSRTLYSVQLPPLYSLQMLAAVLNLQSLQFSKTALLSSFSAMIQKVRVILGLVSCFPYFGGSQFYIACCPVSQSC